MRYWLQNTIIKMLLLKFIIIATIRMAISVNSVYIGPKALNKFKQVVKKSDTCIILVVSRKVELVSSGINATNQLAGYGDVLKNKDLVIIKSTFKPHSKKDILVKLVKIGQKYDTFLAYFRAANRKSVKASITTETTKPVGLLGNLLAGLGISEDEDGLLPSLLSSLGIKTNVKDIKTIEFEA